eukprot:11615605-Alexandrium_andersonii.AAC.1
MSASLVGSEMCIRDRAIAQWRNCMSSRAEQVGVRERGGKCPARTQAPVSYTHLTLPTICSV